MRADRFRNVGLNAAIVVFGVVLAILGWSLLGSWIGGGAEGDRARSRDIVQLDVRNGCGRSGLAGRMADYLTDEGLDVVEQGDWIRFDVERTFVVDRIGDDAPARTVLRLLELDEDRIRTDVRANYYLDATLVIGCDFESLAPFRDDD